MECYKGFAHSPLSWHLQRNCSDLLIEQMQECLSVCLPDTSESNCDQEPRAAIDSTGDWPDSELSEAFYSWNIFLPRQYFSLVCAGTWPSVAWIACPWRLPQEDERRLECLAPITIVPMASTIPLPTSLACASLPWIGFMVLKIHFVICSE